MTSIRAACASTRRSSRRIRKRLTQRARGVLDYDRRHGYRGAEAYVDLAEIKSEQDEALDELLLDFHDPEDLHPAIVLQADARRFAPTAAAAKSSPSAATA
jgi:membrane carboxypeptidase/penicillin-binding protein